MSSRPTRSLAVSAALLTSLTSLSSLGVVSTSALGSSSDPTNAGPAAGNPRYLERHDYRPAPGDITTELRGAREDRITFSPLVDQIVADFSSTDFDQRLRDLSGMNSVLVGGVPYTFHTRHTFSEGGQKSWQYAYEQLEALGLAVRYQEYVWNGNHFQNVIATIPGEVTPDRVYVLGGHIDSTSPQSDTLAPGAEDNGSGSSGVLAAAAALAGKQFESTIELVLFSGEEQGLWGSDHYVDVALSEGVDIRSAVIMDMIAYYSNDWGVIIEGENAWASLMGDFSDAVDQYTSLSKEFSYFSWGSDHVPFQDAGIPAILAIDQDWSEYPYYHSTQDTYEKTNPSFGVEIASAALATIAQLAGPIETPSAVDPGPLSSSAPTFVAYPNPSSDLVQFVIRSAAAGTGPATAATQVFVTDVHGRRVRSLERGIGADSSVEWNLRDDRGTLVAPGIYWAHSAAGTARVVVIR